MILQQPSTSIEYNKIISDNIALNAIQYKYKEKLVILQSIGIIVANKM